MGPVTLDGGILTLSGPVPAVPSAPAETIGV